MKYFYIFLSIILLSSCEPLFDDLICSYEGYRTKKDNMNRCYYTNGIGQEIFVDNSYCNCLL